MLAYRGWDLAHPWQQVRRYSEFAFFHDLLCDMMPVCAGKLSFPPKKLFGSDDFEVVSERLDVLKVPAAAGRPPLRPSNNRRSLPRVRSSDSGRPAGRVARCTCAA